MTDREKQMAQTIKRLRWELAMERGFATIFDKLHVAMLANKDNQIALLRMP